MKLKVGRGELQAERGAAFGIHFRTAPNRRPRQIVSHLGAQRLDLVGADDVLEDIEAVLPIGIQDVVRKPRAGLEPHRAAVANRVGPAQAVLDVVSHRGRMFGSGWRSNGFGHGLRVVTKRQARTLPPI